MTDGDAAFDILAFALGDAGTGRLYKRLVHETQLAQQVSVFQWSKGFSSIFGIQVTAKQGSDLKAIESIVNDEIDKIRTQPISPSEFDRAIANIEAGYVWQLESLMARADLLQRYNHTWGDPDGVERDLQRYRNNSPKSLLKLAKQYLGKENRVEVVAKPRSGAPTAQEDKRKSEPPTGEKKQ